ncbi:MAG: ATP-binding protein [Candidatus Babeliales bacterium]
MKIIPRSLTPYLLKAATGYPVIEILGPRQSGKTTLSRAAFPDYRYVSLENPDNRAFAKEDPRGFLDHHRNPNGIIIDEVQYAPDLLSYIQTDVDLTGKKGYYVITGSQNILLNEAVSQSLAGRVSIFTLLPFSLEELAGAHLVPESLEEMLFKGCYPRIWADKLDPLDWYPNYINTYIERDVRLIKNVTDLSLFQKFMGLCAGRVGQILNYSAIANDCGVTMPTVKAWISILEQSYICFEVQPYHNNFSKRLIKSSKLYFYDTGLACSLLGITSSDQLANHYLKGGIFESFVISELIKQNYNSNRRPRMYFWRDQSGHEIDCIIEKGTTLIPIEIKAGKTINQGFTQELTYWNELSATNPKDNIIVYGGTQYQQRSAGLFVDWQSLPKLTSLIIS